MSKQLVWSYSFLNTYIRCARQGQAQYITKELPYTESPETAHGDRVHSAAETALKLKQFPIIPYDDLVPYFQAIYSIPAYKKIEPEMKLGVGMNWEPKQFFDNDVWGRGKLDVPILVNPETAIIFDWKTGKEWEDPFELEVQAVLLKAKYPELKVIKGAYIWLKEDKYGPTYDLHQTLDKTRDKIEGVMEKVGKGLFYAQPNALCGWCALKTCRHWKERKK